MEQYNKLVLFKLQKIIEDGMTNEIDLDEDIPVDIINGMAKLHSDIIVLLKGNR